MAGASLRVDIDVMYVIECSGTLYWSTGLYESNTPQSSSGSLSSFLTSHSESVVIPIDPMTAFNLNWITEDQFLAKFPNMPEEVRAAVRLVL